MALKMKRVSADRRMPEIRRYYRMFQDTPALQRPNDMEEFLLDCNQRVCVPPLSSPEELTEIHNLAFGIVSRKPVEIPGVPTNVTTSKLEIVRGDLVAMKKIVWLWPGLVEFRLACCRSLLETRIKESHL